MRTFATAVLTSTLIAPLGPVFAADRPGPIDVFGQPDAVGIASDAATVRVRIDFERLKRLAPRSEVRVALPDGRYDAIFDGIQAYAAGVTEWRAHLATDPDRRIVIIDAPDGVTGYVRTPIRRWKLATLRGGQYLVADGEAVRRAVSANSGAHAVLNYATPSGAPPAASKMPDAPAGVAAYPVSFDVVGLSDLPPNSETDLTLPNAGNYKVSYENSVANADGTTTWVGHLRDYGDDYRVVVTYGPDGTDGHILTPYGEFLLGMSGGNQWLVDVARSGLKAPPESGSDAAVHPGPASQGVSPAAAGLLSSAPGVPAAGLAARSATPAAVSVLFGKPIAATDTLANATIDVLVLYTDGFKARLGAGASNRIASLVALANQAYKDSGIAITLRLAGTAQVAYTDTNSDNTALSDLTAGRGAFANVSKLRADYGADLVTVLRPLHTKARMSCGLAWIGGYGGSSVAASAGSAYSVVGDGSDMDGRGYYCGDYSLAHELGHNMGSMHDRATVAAQGGGQGAYPYSFGYGRAGAFGTVMSYIQPVIGKFSNPAVKTCAGALACGVAETDTRNSANNALSMNNTRASVAAYMPTTVPVVVAITGVVSTTAGTPLAGATLTAAGASCTQSGANGAYACSVTPGWSGTITASLAGYTFAPASTSYATVASGLASQNFKATAVAPAPLAKKK